MNFKEKIDNIVLHLGWKPIKVEDNREAIHHGVPARQVDITFDRPGGRFKTTHTFAKANGMSEDAMVVVIDSYLKNEEKFKELNSL